MDYKIVVEPRALADIQKAIDFGVANASSVVQYYGAKKGILR